LTSVDLRSILAVMISDQILGRNLHAIADPARRKILDVLRERGACSIDKETGLCASDIESRLSLSQPTISHHMAILTKAGLVEARKIGQWKWYRRNEEALQRLVKSLKESLDG
jgi:DNA-binding transcriptional ArsR family regulator